MANNINATTINVGYGSTIISGWGQLYIPSVDNVSEDIDFAVPVEKKIVYGCDCGKCREHFPHAEVPINKDFVCYGCKFWDNI